MFKAIDSTTNRDVIILDPKWNKTTLGILRSKGAEDELQCPTCEEPVRVRAGEKKRWHFAHKDLSDCPLAYESPNVIQARSLLYIWLRSKLGDAVTIEKQFPGSNLPRLIDCYYETPGGQKIGYWILEKGIRSRAPLQSALQDQGIRVHWVLLSNMARIDIEDPGAIHLSPTERDSIFSSNYNKMYSVHDQALNYLDINESTITTYRGLCCVHLPQLYRWQIKLQNTLTEMLLIKATGELIHPGEYEALQDYEEEQRREELLRQQQEKEFRQRQEQIRNQQFMRHQQLEAQRLARMTVPPPARPLEAPEVKERCTTITDDRNGPYPCEVCGTLTQEWTVYNAKTNTCVCSRECLRKQLGRS